MPRVMRNVSVQTLKIDVKKKVIKRESYKAQTTFSGVTSSIDEIRDKLSSTVAQQLSATDSVLKDTVGKSVKSKVCVEIVLPQSNLFECSAYFVDERARRLFVVRFLNFFISINSLL